MKDEEIIYGILNRICLLRKNIDCKVECSYSDGQENSIYSIIFYQGSGRKMVGRITFQGGTGQICQYFYKGKRFSKQLVIVDLLLDLYNHEKDSLQLLENSSSE